MELFLEGKFDAVSAPKFQKEIADELVGMDDLLIDLEKVEYISSAGLRSLLFLQQTMEEVHGKLVVQNVPEIIEHVFELTGFNNIITVI